MVIEDKKNNKDKKETNAIKKNKPQEIDRTLKKKKPKKKLIQALDDSKFLQALQRQSLQDHSRVLEKSQIIENQIIPTNLENQVKESIPNMSSLNKSKDEDSFKYIKEDENSTGSKYDSPYIASNVKTAKESSFRNQSIKSDLGFKQVNRQTSFSPESTNIEQYVVAEKFDQEKTNKKDPFKKQDIKYTPSKY